MLGFFPRNADSTPNVRSTVHLSVMGVLAWTKHQCVDCASPNCRATKWKRLQTAGHPGAREIRVVRGTRLPRLAARNRDATAVPITDVPHGAETLRESRLLQVNRILVS